jgi:N-acetylglucosaminyldiphosphoundecaprenol N-acetyl-beta-D-mannosaminyltransferase
MTSEQLVQRDPVDILGAPFHPYTFGEVVELVGRAVADGARLQIVPGNVDMVMKARRDPEFLRALHAADLVIADGVPILWAARTYRTPLRGRVSGTDLVEACARVSADHGVGMALVGAAEGVAARAAAAMSASHPASRLVCIPTPFPLDEDALQGVLQRIKEEDCRIVLAALGAPRQERFAARALDEANANVAIGVGSAFDIIAGDRPRAPAWMRDNGLEWAHRLRLEPRRLARRYLVEDSPFVMLLARSAVERLVHKNGFR